MSIELISKIKINRKSSKEIITVFLAPNDVREAQRIGHDKIRKHYGHEFIPK
jgi:hypothetical protein